MLAMEIRIGVLDSSIIAIYLIGIVVLGCAVGLFRRRGASGGKEYFLAGGTLTWPVIGLALFSTNISTIHLVSQAQEGYMNGLAYGNFEWMAPFTLIALALFFAPFYIRSKVATLPDFLERRYNPACRNWLAVLSIISAVFIHIGFTLYTGAVVLEGLFGIPKMTSIIGVSILTGLYTIVGGLLAVVVTESIQTIILLFGAICITAIGFSQVGGWEGISSNVEPVKLTMLRDASDPAGLPWYSVFLGYPIIGLWYWCADQTIVQRVLGAKNENHARVGPLFAGFIKILPVFIFVLPGTICLALLNQGKLPPLPVKQNAIEQTAQPTSDQALSAAEQRVYDAVLTRAQENKGEAAGAGYIMTATGLGEQDVYGAMSTLVDRKLLKVKSEDVYAHMITELLPPGLRGIVAAALLAALMSTVSGALNSIATLFSYDIYKQLRPDAPDRSLIRTGRIATFIGMVVAIIWSPAIAHYESIYQGSNALICYIAPPITAVFVWGVMWRGASSSGALMTLLAGSFLGAVVFFLDWFKDVTHWKVPFMMAAFYLFVICSVILIGMSLWKPDPVAVVAERGSLSWKNPLEALKGPAWRGIGNFRLLAGVLFVTMVVLYIIFA